MAAMPFAQKHRAHGALLRACRKPGPAVAGWPSRRNKGGGIRLRRMPEDIRREGQPTTAGPLSSRPSEAGSSHPSPARGVAAEPGRRSEKKPLAVGQEPCQRVGADRGFTAAPCQSAAPTGRTGSHPCPPSPPYVEPPCGASNAERHPARKQGFTRHCVPRPCGAAAPCQSVAPTGRTGSHPCPPSPPYAKAPLRGPLRMAERVGFEPTVGSHLRLISSQVHSTTLPPLRWCSG